MIKGKAHVYGDHINTDLIIAGKYTKTLNLQNLADHCLEDLDPEFRSKVCKGDIIVAGENFGCGSSREQAPVALKAAGVSAVLAKSFARIFFRNAINIGLVAVACDTSSIVSGDTVEVDIADGEVIVNDEGHISCKPLPPVMRSILDHGGLTQLLKEKGDFEL